MVAGIDRSNHGPIKSSQTVGGGLSDTKDKSPLNQLNSDVMLVLAEL